MHKNATKCNKTQSKWCINKHGASKIIDTFETYQMLTGLSTAPDNLYVVPYLGRSLAPTATWNLHTTQPKYFAPTSSEVVNLTGLL
jgi:hypothetical protein